jgi:hypothetical protein
MNNKNTSFIVIIIVMIAIMAGGFIFYSFRNNNDVAVTPVQVDNSVTYRNDQYGFTFSLPDSWKGYTVIENTWKGTPLNSTVAQSGPKLLIRNPKWTASATYEDLPILIFTLQQWNSYLAENFTVSAAPIMASEMARNDKYVFALPPRWDYDYSLGVEEAQKIIANKPIKTFNVGSTSQAKINIEAVCNGALAYTTFTDGKSANLFVKDCIDGKHPEVIERYKADLNLNAGVEI